MGLDRFLNPAQREAMLASVLSSITGVALLGLTEGTSRYIVVGSGIVVASALFFWRLRFRFLYGLIEIIFGLFVLYDASGKGRGAFNSDFQERLRYISAIGRRDTDFRRDLCSDPRNGQHTPGLTNRRQNAV